MRTMHECVRLPTRYFQAQIENSNLIYYEAYVMSRKTYTTAAQQVIAIYWDSLSRMKISLRDCLHFLRRQYNQMCDVSADKDRRNSEQRKEEMTNKEMIFLHFLRPRLFFILFCVIYWNGVSRLYMSTLTTTHSAAAFFFMHKFLLCGFCCSFSFLSPSQRWKYICIH